MNIGIITYDIPHLKTQQIIKGLLKKKYKLSIFITTFKKYKKRTALLNHRPNQFTGLGPYELSSLFDLKIFKLENILSHKYIDYFLIGGAGIIEEKYIIKNKIINCHPGLIPLTRGLDSLKWSIFNNNLIGNSLHFLDKSIDNGKIISHKITPIYKNDNFKKLFKRHYKIEIDMLVNFEKYLLNPNIYKLAKGDLHKRMSESKEMLLSNKFKEYKLKNIKN